MDYKYVDITDSVSTPVPIGLTPEEEANFIAGRIAFVNLQELETECREMLQLLDDGKLIKLESVIEELENEMDSTQPL